MKPAYEKEFIAEPRRRALFEELLMLPWLEVKQARKEFFMSDVSRTYTYDKGGYEYTSTAFTPAVTDLLLMLGGEYNVCFLNR